MASALLVSGTSSPFDVMGERLTISPFTVSKKIPDKRCGNEKAGTR